MELERLVLHSFRKLVYLQRVERQRYRERGKGGV